MPRGRLNGAGVQHVTQESEWPGRSFGAPAAGPGSIAGLGQRISAFLIDSVLSALLTWLFTGPHPPENLSLLIWSVITVLGIGTFGLTPGHLIMGIQVGVLRSADRSRMIGLWAIPRTVLVALVLPPLIQDRDGRGLHDRLCATVVVRTR